MDFAQFLTDILVVLVAAKVAAEVSERIGIPAVVGEIVAGVLVGPSVLGLVDHGDNVLVTLGEIGVILLLLEVGMEMDLAELGKVGKASFQVATIGVITPMVLGFFAMGAVTDDFNTKLFMGAALTATSVGITARVFGDLRALATTEARLVLGAAVADDVMGLVVLTVVVRLVTQGSVSLLSVLGIILVAVAFLVVGGFAGLKLAEPLFAFVERVSRSTGTLVAIGFAFALAFARLADAAKLAPIVGAFVAGIALSQTSAAERIGRELRPVGHLFIPVFFLQIGIDADVEAFFSTSVLKDAGILLAVAIVGKLVAAVGAVGTRSDKWLIGLGMLPRGEVGLIFATIGLQNGVLGDELYASLLLVVLVTTLVTPPLLKFRYTRLRTALVPSGPPAGTAPPHGGWLRVEDGQVDLAARPPIDAGLQVALAAAVFAGRHRPSDELQDWLSDLPGDGMDFDATTREAFLDVVERGNARSWRFLLTTGTLDRALPELADSLKDREDQVGLDTSAAYRLRSVERLRVLDADDPLVVEARKLEDLDVVLVALLAVDASDGAPNRTRLALAVAERLGFDDARARKVAALADDGDQLLWSAAHRPAGLTAPAVMPIVTHLETPERARGTFVLTALRQVDAERWERERLHQLHDLLQAVLSDTGLTGTGARSLVAQRRQDAIAELGDAAAPRVAERIEAAPNSFVLRLTPQDLATAAAMIEPAPKADAVRVRVVGRGAGQWTVLVAAKDRLGLLAMVSGVLTARGLNISRALVATWLDGAAVEAFEVQGPEIPTAERLGEELAIALDSPVMATPLPEARVQFDDASSPWHTLCEVEAPDRPGLLHQLATAFAAAGVDVVAASVGDRDQEAVDTFELVTGDGEKLADVDRRKVREAIAGGAELTRRRFRGGLVAR